jgi:hypothetical protein
MRHSDPESRTYLVRVQVSLRVICDTIVVLEFLKQSRVGSQRSVRYNCNILEPHGIWGTLYES